MNEEHVTQGDSDLKVHVLSKDCWCAPTVEAYDAGGNMVSRRVTHNVSPGMTMEHGVVESQES